MLICATDGRQFVDASIAYPFFFHFCVASSSVYRKEPLPVVLIFHNLPRLSESYFKINSA